MLATPHSPRHAPETLAFRSDSCGRKDGTSLCRLSSIFIHEDRPHRLARTASGRARWFGGVRSVTGMAQGLNSTRQSQC